MRRERKAFRAVFFSIAGNMGLTLIKGLSGILGNSHALIADAIESMTDVFSSLFVYMGIRYSQRPADAEHPYGYGRVEPLMTFVIVGFLVVASVVIARESIYNIRHPHKIPEAWTLIVLGVIILWKEYSYRYVEKIGRKTGSSSLRADAWHHRSDALTSAAAFVGITVAVIFGDGYETADDWAALFASGFILYNAYRIFRPAFGEIIDEGGYDEIVERIRKEASRVEGIRGTEKCLVRKSGMRYHVVLHARVDADISVKAGHELAHVLKDRLVKDMPELDHIIIHVEPYDPEYQSERQ